MTNLPMTQHPIYDFAVPSTGKKIKYRPFLTREKKILLIALETKDDGEIIKAVRQIITNCVLDPKFDVDSLASFDIELFFLHLRAKSDSEIVESTFTCQNVVEGQTTVCGQKLETKYNILETKITEDPTHSKKILFGQDSGIMMKYPTFTMLEKFSKENKSKTEVAFNFIQGCVDYIFDKENIYKASEMSAKELTDYLDLLENKNFQKLEHFIQTMPKVRNLIDKTCPKCKFEHRIPVEGLSSFFD